MINIKKKHSEFIKSIVKKELKSNANTTSCMLIYQPKVPQELKKFSKIDDK